METEEKKVEKKSKPKTAAARQRIQLRNKLWPEILDSQLWLRSQRVGFTTIPRTMALIGRIMDQLSGKGVPLTSTYLTLWCWVFDEGFVEIKNPKELAYESGFNGKRGEITWKNRMKKLESLGFILTKPGLFCEFQYVLILNPIKVIEKYYEDTKSRDLAYNTLLSRLIKVGADDLNG